MPQERNLSYPLNEPAESLIRDWYEREPGRRRSRIGIPNAGLHVLEVFRHNWPLRERQYLTEGGGQVAGLSGPSGDIIVSRFNSNLRSLGTEAGRTSRSTPAAARRLAERLNALPRELVEEPAARAALADKMQLWIIHAVLAPQLKPDGDSSLSIDSGEPSELAVRRYLDQLGDVGMWKIGAARLLIAATEASGWIETAPHEERSRGTQASVVQIGDMSIILSEIPTFADLEACRAVLDVGNRCMLLTPENRSLASAQLLEAGGLRNVEVEAASRFVARLIDIASGFERHARDELVAKINSHLLGSRLGLIGDWKAGSQLRLDESHLGRLPPR